MSLQEEIQKRNFSAGKTMGALMKSSLGPRGSDKMIIDSRGDVLITNDGATILGKVNVSDPCAKLLLDVSKAQDVEAGDGTTTVIVLVGAMLQQAESIIAKNVNANTIARGFLEGANLALEILEKVAKPVAVEDRQALLHAATTSMSSKVISQYSNVLAPISVDAVRAVYREPSNPKDEANVDLTKIRVVKCLGGVVDESELILNGMILNQKASKMAGGPTTMKNAQIGLIQFQLSPPKTDMENTVVVSDYNQIDRVIREEREYLAKLVQKIKKAGCNVLLIQKSILRDAVTETSLNFLAKMKIMVIRDIERNDIEFISSSLGCQPVASIDNFRAEKLGTCEFVEEVDGPGGKLVKFTGIKPRPGGPPCVSILLRGSTNMILDESERSLHDALCVVRALHKKKFLLPGGGAPEMEIATKLTKIASTIEGVKGYIIQKYAEAFETIAYSLAENAGLSPVDITSDLKQRHVKGEHNAGINVKKGSISDMVEENVVQPLLVTSSAIKLATETVACILKIDDIVETR